MAYEEITLGKVLQRAINRILYQPTREDGKIDDSSFQQFLLTAAANEEQELVNQLLIYEQAPGTDVYCTEEEVNDAHWQPKLDSHFFWLLDRQKLKNEDEYLTLEKACRPGEYEIIALHESGKHVYTRLDNDQLLEDLHEALGRRCTPNSVTDADRTLASETIRQYGKLEMNSDVLRCKLYSILLSAYTILEATDECENLIGMILKILPLVKAEQARAGLLVTLYGCTDSSLDYERAHEIVDRWKKEESPKKSKLRLIRWLDDYDRWLGH